jgi:Raf kinase inhibitor-like YbhB/YbcL family protein
VLTGSYFLLAIEYPGVTRDTPTAVPRRTVLAGAIAVVAGCTGGGDDSADDDGGTDDGGGTDDDTESTPDTDSPATGEVNQMGELTLTSPAFDHGEQIPGQYGRQGDDVNPPLEIGNVPDGAASLALIVDDPDAVEPAGKVWDHWIVWNVPPETKTIPEDWEPTEAQQGTNDFGEVGYGGPSPPDREHRYRFKLFALDTKLDLPPETDAEALGAAMEGHVLAATQLDGTFPA